MVTMEERLRLASLMPPHGIIQIHILENAHSNDIKAPCDAFERMEGLWSVQGESYLGLRLQW
ncbi:MAG: hypothetical protein ACE5OZ_05350 [Candidatus Heimdallarchaeota archaeon]